MKIIGDLTVLFVEDEKAIRDSYIPLLERRFKKVYAAENGEAGVSQYKSFNPDVIITDIAMPKLNGLEMVRKIREEDKDVSVVFLSAYTEKDYLLEAIELRPIKYFVKPINFEDFDDFFINHFQNSLKSTIYLGQNFYFDYENSQIINKNNAVTLTQKEREFLNLLIKYGGNLVSYDVIENAIWKDKFMSSDSLRTLVKKIRKKSYNDLIKNVSNTGYKIEITE